jgi:hypothetical protein
MEDIVLAKPSGDCCLDSFPHEGTPRGSWVRIADIDTYVSKPSPGSETNRDICYMPDVWGISHFVNGQLLVDYFADQGEFVVTDLINYVTLLFKTIMIQTCRRISGSSSGLL